jgi:hypothetical protein
MDFKKLGGFTLQMFHPQLRFFYIVLQAQFDFLIENIIHDVILQNQGHYVIQKVVFCDQNAILPSNSFKFGEIIIMPKTMRKYLRELLDLGDY